MALRHAGGRTVIAEVAIVSAAVVACFAITERRVERESRTARIVGTSAERVEEASKRARESAALVDQFGTQLDQLQREQRAIAGRVQALEMTKGGMR